ncbi:hypothetical protein FJZ17_01970 [Candidatus Pacearchaeota archaeon]|nr:hypothetical protein [Candidatus Pacearchaeota archaeon]
MKFGEIFSLSWKEYKSHFKLYTGLMLLFFGIPALIFYAIDYYSFFNFYNPSGNIIYNSIALITTLLLFFITLFVQVGILGSSLNKKYDAKSVKLFARKYYWKYFGFIIVLTIFLFLWALLLIIPAIIFAVYWIFAGVILLAENKGIRESLRASKALVKGKWWKVFGFFIIFSAIMLLINLVISILSLPTSILLFLDVLKNPTLYVEGVTATTFIFKINLIVQYLTSFLFQVISAPLGILFMKNFYLAMKKK